MIVPASGFGVIDLLVVLLPSHGGEGSSNKCAVFNCLSLKGYLWSICFFFFCFVVFVIVYHLVHFTASAHNGFWIGKYEVEFCRLNSKMLSLVKGEV